MANTGWSDDERYADAHSTDHRPVAGDQGLLVQHVARPTSVSEQHARGGWMRSETPWDSGGEALAGLKKEQYATGEPCVGPTSDAYRG